MEYRKDVQGLRALAVLFVIVFHINPAWLPGGFIGVDVFFVISGYLISSIILSKLDDQKFSLIDFYISRIKRIVPAYYFLLIIVAIAGLFIYVSLSDVQRFRDAFFWSALFDSNRYFSTLDTYFGVGNKENPLLHTWTLAVEMKFYLFLPLLLLFIKRKWLFGVILLLTVTLFAYSSIEIIANNNKSEMYYSLLARTPEFFIGVLTCVLREKVKTTREIGLAISLIGLFLLISSAIFINENSLFPGFLAIVPCIGTAFLIVAPQNQIQVYLSNKVLAFIGELSYSLYLWHWPIMAYFRYYYNATEFNISQIIIILLLSFILSLFSFYFIEKPFRRKKGIRFSLLISSLIAVNALAVYYVVPISKKLNIIPVEYSGPYFGLDSHGSSFKEVQTFGDTLATIKKRIFFTGDSHALCMKAYLDYIGEKNSFKFNTITNDSYPLLPDLPKDVFNDSRLYKRYMKLINYAQSEIDKSDIIILQYAGDGHRWIAAIDALIKKLNSNQNLIILSDYPRIVSKNPITINRSIKKDPTKIFDCKIKYIEPANGIIELLKSNSNCYFFDISKSQVFKDIPFYNDTIMYYDKGHLNVYGARAYAKDTESEFMNLLNQVLLK